MRPAGAGLRELCAEAGCTTDETTVMLLLADGHSVDLAAAELLVSPSKAWALRRSAKRRIRERYGINPDDVEYETGIQNRREAALELRQHGHSYRYIGERLGINHRTVQRLVEDAPNIEEDIRVDWQVDSDDFGGTRTDPVYLDHWPSSTGIDPFLEPGTPGGPPIHPVTTRRVGEDG